MATNSSLPCPQQLIMCPYLKPDESIPHPSILSLLDPL